MRNQIYFWIKLLVAFGASITVIECTVGAKRDPRLDPFIVCFFILSFYFNFKTASESIHKLDDFLSNNGNLQRFFGIIPVAKPPTRDITAEAVKAVKDNLYLAVYDVLCKKEWHFQHLDLSSIIDNPEKFATLVHSFEYDNTPSSHFICGLLLEGRIISYAEDLADDYLNQYHVKRAHDAITFYIKAASCPDSKPFIDCILWEIQTTTPHSSIKDRLAIYDIPPPAIHTYNHFLVKTDSVRLPFFLPLKPSKSAANNLHTITKTYPGYQNETSCSTSLKVEG